MKDNYKIFKDKVGMTYEQYYKLKYKKFCRFAWQFTKKDIEDSVIESFINLINYIDSFDETKNIDTYMMSIIKNIINRKHNLKKIRNEFFYQEYETEDKNNNFFPFQIAYDSGEYEKEYEEEIHKNYNIMIDCISKLPKKYEDIITARELRGLDYQEIADEYHIGLSKVKNYIRVGRELAIKKYTAYKTIKK